MTADRRPRSAPTRSTPSRTGCPPSRHRPLLARGPARARPQLLAAAHQHAHRAGAAVPARARRGARLAAAAARRRTRPRSPATSPTTRAGRRSSTGSGCFDVFASPWFAAIYLLLFVSLVGCVLPRLSGTRRAPCGPRRRPRRATWPGCRRPPSFTAAGAPEAVRGRRGRAAARLDRPWPRTEDGGVVTVAAEKGYLRETGNLLFHLALVVLLVGVALGSSGRLPGRPCWSTRATGLLQHACTQYDDVHARAGSSTPAGLAPFSFTARRLQRDVRRPAGRPAAVPRRPSTYVDGSGRRRARATVLAGEPAAAGRRRPRCSCVGHGYAPDSRSPSRTAPGVQDLSRSVPAAGRQLLLSEGVRRRLPDARAGPQLAFDGLLLPDGRSARTGPVDVDLPRRRQPGAATSTPAPATSALDDGAPQSVYTLDSEVADGALKQVGAAQLIAAQARRHLDAARRHGTVDVRRRSSSGRRSRSPTTPARRSCCSAAGAVVLGLLVLLAVRAAPAGLGPWRCGARPGASAYRGRGRRPGPHRRRRGRRRGRRRSSTAPRRSRVRTDGRARRDDRTRDAVDRAWSTVAIIAVRRRARRLLRRVAFGRRGRSRRPSPEQASASGGRRRPGAAAPAERSVPAPTSRPRGAAPAAGATGSAGSRSRSTALGLAVQLGARWSPAASRPDRVPWGNMYEFTLAWSTLVGRPPSWWCSLRRPAACATSGSSSPALRAARARRSPATVALRRPARWSRRCNSYWLVIHVMAAIIATGAFLVGVVVAALYLVRDRLRPARSSRGHCPYRRSAARLPATDVLDRLAYRHPRVRVPALDLRGHRRRDLGRERLGSLLGLGPQGDLGVHHLGRLRGLPARPRDRRLEGPRLRVDRARRLRLPDVQLLRHQPARERSALIRRFNAKFVRVSRSSSRLDGL